MMPCLHRRNRSPQQDEQFPLTDGYSIRSKAYLYDGDLHLCGSESELLDNDDKVRYAWRNLDTMVNSAPCFATATESTI